MRTYVRIYGEQNGQHYELLPPKSRAGERTIPLMESTIAALKAHRARQRREMLRKGVMVRLDTPVVATRKGEHYTPSYLQRMLKAWAAEVGEVTHWHALRHTYATILLASGASMRTLATLLGHADPALTIRVYAHSPLEVLREDVARMADYMGS